MNETDYWARLEFRISYELAGSDETITRGLWCDGLIPKKYIFDSQRPRITGRAWIGVGRGQQQWAFTLYLRVSARNADEVDWQELLPTDNMTNWLGLDPESRQIEIDLDRAEADGG